MTDKDDLFNGIEEAANSLFDQYIVKQPKPAPAASPEPELELALEIDTDTTSTTATEAPPEPELEFVAKPAVATPAPLEPELAAETPAAGDGDQLFGELEEALLTIDWEVSQDSILKGREILTRLVAAQGWTATSPVGQVTAEMDKVLASMLESPANSPTSAPSQLKNALQAIRETRTASDTPDAEVSKLLEATHANLQALLAPGGGAAGYPSQDISNDLQAATPVESIPQAEDEPSFDLGMEMSIEATEDQSLPGEAVPEATASVLKSYATVIAESIRLITPMENLFASRPAMAKLHSAAKQLKGKLSGQQELLRGTFSADYSTYSGLGTVHGWLESQLDVLKGCVNRISKLEKLFGKTAGYEKLFKRSKKIRQSLEKQDDAITVAVGGTPTQHQFDLTGEYPAVIQPAVPQEPESPAAVVSAAVVSAVAAPETMVDKCISLAKSIELDTTDNPQDTGLKIRETLEKLKIVISGSAVHSPGATAAANAAVSVAGHSTKCRWDWLLKTSWGGQLVGIAPEQVAFESKSTFPVKSFKDMTFFNLKKLKSMPWTNLQGMFSGELAELDNSVLNDMELEIAQPPASFPGSAKKKVYLAILYSGGRGKVYLIDSPSEAISVAEEALWVPGTSSQSDIAGTLTVYGSTMPVVSID